jgi:ATP/maltotriose-dependent transcriptional regulator MalT
MKQSQHFLENAENCAQLAERAIDEPTHKRYKRMEAAWRALAEEQDWLDGEVSPTRTNSDALKRPLSQTTRHTA